MGGPSNSGPDVAEQAVPCAHLVVTETGLFGVYLDGDQADARARDIEGVVASLPITADYRTPGRPR